jgi:quercetin dioxygenase-like cupin family protein
MDRSLGIDGPNSVGGGLVWLNGADGERQAIRVDSRDTHGAYSVIESIAEPGCAVPTHRHREDGEHFLVFSGRYRIAIGDQVLDAPPGTRATVPRSTPHSWRNIAAEESQLLAILTPGGFEQISTRSKTLHPRRSETSLRDLAATSWDHRSRNDPQEHGGCAPTARQPANTPKPSIATPVETTAAKYSVGQDIPLEAARR